MFTAVEYSCSLGDLVMEKIKKLTCELLPVCIKNALEIMYKEISLLYRALRP